MQEEAVTTVVSSPTPEASGERTPRSVSAAPEVQVNGDASSGGEDETEPRGQSELPLYVLFPYRRLPTEHLIMTEALKRMRKMLSRNLQPPRNQVHL